MKIQQIIYNKLDFSFVKQQSNVISNYMIRLLFFHLGFDDRGLLRIVDGKIYDIFFIKIN